MGQDKYVGTTRKSGGRHKWNGTVKTDASSLDLPRRWRKGRLIFVNSMSDLFHEGVSFEFIRAVFTVMEGDATAQVPGVDQASGAARTAI
jgi:protein gp37